MPAPDPVAAAQASTLGRLAELMGVPLQSAYAWVPPARAAQIAREEQAALDARHAAAALEVEGHSDFLGTIWDILPVGSDAAVVTRAEAVAKALRGALAPFRGEG